MRKIKLCYIHILTTATLLAILKLSVIPNAFALDKPEIISTPENIPVPHTDFPLLYIIHAKKASLLKKSDNSFGLILHDTDKVMTYQFSQPVKSSDILKLNDFLVLWEKNQPEEVEADVTGLQQDYQTVGHTQFYIRASLSNITRISSIHHELEFKVKIRYPNIDIAKIAYMENVTLFINGCDICTCAGTKITCLK